MNSLSNLFTAAYQNFLPAGKNLVKGGSVTLAAATVTFAVDQALQYLANSCEIKNKHVFNGIKAIAFIAGTATALYLLPPHIALISFAVDQVFLFMASGAAAGFIGAALSDNKDSERLYPGFGGWVGLLLSLPTFAGFGALGATIGTLASIHYQEKS